MFLVIFRMIANQNDSVSDLLVRSNGIVQWDVSFIGDVHEWELDKVTDFFSFLYSLAIGGNLRDRNRMIWKPSSSKKFSVQHSSFFPWK